jgi:heat shock protein HtpX
MAIALALDLALLCGLLALAAWLLTVYWGPLVLLVVACLAAAGGAVGARRWRRYMLPSDRAAPVERAIERLCLVADLDEPLTALVADDVPLSWTTAPPGRRPRVHVTTGMVELLDDAGLQAVLAHELSHIGNRDAVLMTVLAAPGVRVLRSLHVTWRHAAEQHWTIALAAAVMCAVLAVPALVSVGVSRIVSRHRELAADRGAALLTGSPAALAAALAQLSDGLHAIPDRDLRVAAVSDVLHVVPAKPANGIARLWATHPPLEDRIHRLERLEAQRQA